MTLWLSKEEILLMNIPENKLDMDWNQKNLDSSFFMTVINCLFVK